MRHIRVLSSATIFLLLALVAPLSQAGASLNALSLVLTSSSASSTYGSPAPSTTVDVSFISSGATDEYVRVSALIASMPAGQIVQPSLGLLSSSNSNVQSSGAVSSIYPTTAGVVNSKFTVSITSVNQLPAGTYVLMVVANSSTSPDTLRQNVTFTINPAPTPALSVGLSKIWMMSGTTSASESNYSNSISAPATVNTSIPVANISVDLRDTNNSQITNLPIVAAVTGPGLISIGSSPGSNLALGRAALGQAGQYSISLFGDGTYGTSTISIYQNGQLVGTKSITFVQSTPLPQSVSIANVNVDKTSVSANGNIAVQFTTTTTSLPTGQLAYASLTYGEDCADDNCNVTVPADLIAGDSSSGKWIANLSVPSTALSGIYAVTIHIPKLKGVAGFFYRHPQTITVAGIDPKPVPPPATISMSNLTFNQTSLKTGETLIVRLNVSSSNLPTGVPMQASIYSPNDCEDESCISYGTGKLVSGNSEQGIWEIQIPIHSTLITGTYSLNYGFFKLKGTSGAIGTYSDVFKVSGVIPKPVPPPVTISMSNLMLSQTKLTTGETLVIRLNLKSTNMPAGVPLQASIYSPNDCEDESCISYGVGKLVSGTLEQGIWEIPVSIHSTLTSGTYSINYGFFKLKGTAGAIGTLANILVVTGAGTITSPPTFQFFNLAPTSAKVKSGGTLNVQFDLKTTGVDSGELLQVYLTDPTGNSCMDGCGLGYAKLIKGSISGGSWLASLSVPQNLRSGSYDLIAAFPKFKGVAGSYSVSPGSVYVDGYSQIMPTYIFSSGKVSSNLVKAGQTIKGYFSLKTNDEKVSTPACIIDGVSNWVDATLMNGSSMSGSWECTVDVPAKTISGSYKLQVAVVGYANGNKNEQWANLGTMVISGAPKDAIFTPTPIDDVPIEDDGVEEEPTGTLKVKKEPSGKYLLTVASNLEEESISIVATKKGKPSIRFSVSTKVNGSIQIRTSRILSGYTLKLMFDGQTLKTTKVA
ncbi:hypothetical protein MCEMRE26_00088 [Candidatus Nanopelagicaceae bacterium]